MLEQISALEVGALTYVAAVVIVFAGAFVQGTFGMGFGQVAAPVLLLVDPQFVPGSILFMGLAAACAPAYRDRRNIQPKELGVALSGRILGAIVAGHIMAYVIDRELFSLLFAAMVLLAVGLSATSWKVQPTNGALFTAGGLSGIMATITSIGAPPMGLIYQNRPGPNARATLNAFFALGVAASILTLLAYGLLGLKDLMLAAILVPGLALGSWMSRYGTGFVDRRFRPLILSLCGIAAILIIIKTLF